MELHLIFKFKIFLLKIILQAKKNLFKVKKYVELYKYKFGKNFEEVNDFL